MAKIEREEVESELVRYKLMSVVSPRLEKVMLLTDRPNHRYAEVMHDKEGKYDPDLS